MRLINTRTLLLSDEVFGNDIPEYAILSHAWTNEEVSFTEWLEPWPAIKSKAGYVKLRDACAVALASGNKWLWADTVCIDKSSSAELSEAINSMYAWYRDSVECLVYLVDVEDSAEDSGSSLLEQFVASRWFTRGWTLQELVAPSSLTFYTRRWKLIGSRYQFASVIGSATGIVQHAFQIRDVGWVHKATIAERMSWIARRTTTRVEDMAYCMLGIFEINMPLLYGEGQQAFLRLQHEILRTYHDHTIFAWTWPSKGNQPLLDFGVLAPSPAAFGSHAGAASLLDTGKEPTPYTITNLGLSIRLPTLRTAGGTPLAILEAASNSQPGFSFAVALHQSSGRASTWARAAHPQGPILFCNRLPKPSPAPLFLRVRPAGEQRSDRAQEHDGEVSATSSPPAPLFLRVRSGGEQRSDRAQEQDGEVPATSSPPAPLFLRVRSGGEQRSDRAREQEDEEDSDTLSPPVLPQHALFLVFNGDAAPVFHTHPPGCVDVNRGLLVFPTSSWKELCYAASRSRHHTMPPSPVFVRTAAVAVCINHRAAGDQGMTLLFTVSLVITKEDLEQEGAPARRAFPPVFGNGVELPRDWHPAPLSSVFTGLEKDRPGFKAKRKYFKQWLDRDERVAKLVQDEMEWVADNARFWPEVLERAAERRHGERDGGLVQVGCCDAAYSGVEETRVAWIDVTSK